ncbi:MTRF1L release factor glutamine methyltransferase isoform X2 [Suricata suricatta]|uniref:MTRF1L release factor glutamine methyltransferase isoform X2 n=1 Tax=Suricata suricatta TaxID=37032 RepID=UPI0011559659|nr:MTRF1L release factor glutamine methyltransferase isoform X2 [Suricata suricatta]
MEIGGRMLWPLLSGLGRRKGTRGWAFSSWQPCRPLAGLLSATELVSHWTAVFEKRGIPEAQASISEPEASTSDPVPDPLAATVRPEAEWLSIAKDACAVHPRGVGLSRAHSEDGPPSVHPSPRNRDPFASQGLVEWVLEEVAQSSCAAGAQGGPLILEVGCGSGAISLSLLSQLPQSRVIAVDKGEAAICLTQENAQRLRLLDRIQIIPLDVTLEGSWAHLLPWGPMDLIVSNPPYVFHQDMEQLAPEIRSYEDPVALDGGKEGMDIITHILALAPWLLKDSGSIFLEVDPRHPELVGSWLQSRSDLSLDLVAVRQDFCGRPRFLHIQRSGPQHGCPVEARPGPQPARVPG